VQSTVNEEVEELCSVRCVTKTEAVFGQCERTLGTSVESGQNDEDCYF
jgi:hypothetical protein